MTTENEHLAYRPGGVSVFFVYKAGFMAAAGWIWLGVLTVRGDTPAGWPLVAASAAITMTLVAVILAARHALARHAAARHEQIMRTLVDLSWQSFTVPPIAASPPAPTPAGEADVIPIQEPRQRPRR
jgi:hypothetical protein